MKKFTTEPSMNIRIPFDMSKFIEKAKADGVKLDVTVEVHREPRSLEQNAKYRAMLKRLSYATNASLEYLDRLCKDRAVLLGYPYSISEYGVVEPKSTKDVTVTQMMLLIEACLMIGYENEIDLEVH